MQALDHADPANADQFGRVTFDDVVERAAHLQGSGLDDLLEFAGSPIIERRRSRRECEIAAAEGADMLARIPTIQVRSNEYDRERQADTPDRFR